MDYRVYANSIGDFFEDLIAESLGISHADDPVGGIDLIDRALGNAPCLGIESKAKMLKGNARTWWPVRERQIIEFPQRHPDLDELWFGFGTYRLDGEVSEVKDDDEFLEITSERRVYFQPWIFMDAYPPKPELRLWRNVPLDDVTNRDYILHVRDKVALYVPKGSTLDTRLTQDPEIPF